MKNKKIKRRPIIAVVAMALALGACGPGGGEDDPMAALMLLLAAGPGPGATVNPGEDTTDAPGGPCVTVTPFSLNPGAAVNDYYGAGKHGYLTDYLRLNLGRSNPAGIIHARQDHAYTDNRPLLFHHWTSDGDAFINQEPILANTYAVSMNPYGMNGYHYAGVMTFFPGMDEEYSARVVVPDSSATVSGWTAVGCTPRLEEDRWYNTDLSGADSGLSHVWENELSLNVHLIFVEGADENATEAGFAPAMERVRTLFGQDTVRIRVNFTSATLSNADYLAIASLNDESGSTTGSLVNMYMNTADVQRDDAVNVFVTREETQIGGVLGISSGIPGLPGVAGNRTAGLTVFVEAHQADPGAPLTADELRFVGDTIVHETGHFLGLFHPSEYTGYTGSRWTRDPLIETPYCEDDRDQPFNGGNGDGLVSATECDGTTYYDSGARNIMFWAAAPFEQTQFTGEQGWVLRSHPLVYR